MRTIIRMQRKGPKNIYTNRMVVQGSYKKLKGMVIENLGFWVYKKLDDHKKSLILNRNRARYWLAMGALLSPKMQRFFSAFDMWCPPYIKWGKATAVEWVGNAEAATRKGIEEHMVDGKGLSGIPIDIEAKINSLSARNAYFRRIKYREQLKNYLDPENSEKFLEEIIAQTPREILTDSEFDRSQKFYHLKKFYEEIENNPKMYAPYKKELIYNRMNELAKQGLMSQEDVEKEQKKLILNTGLDPIEQAMAKEWDIRKDMVRRRLVELEAMINPIDKSEFIARCRQRSFMDSSDFDQQMQGFLSEIKDTKQPFTMLDVEVFLSGMTEEVPDDAEIEEENEILSENKIDKIRVPTKISITPEPDMSLYDPNDWYDMRDANTTKVRAYTNPNDRWFDLPLTEAAQNKARKEQYELSDKLGREKLDLKFFTMTPPIKTDYYKRTKNKKRQEAQKLERANRKLAKENKTSDDIDDNLDDGND